MKSCVVLLLMFFAFSMIIDACITEKVCPERAIPVETPEGTLCVCSQGYFGDNCRFKGEHQSQLVMTGYRNTTVQVDNK